MARIEREGRAGVTDKFGQLARVIARMTSSPGATVAAIVTVTLWAASGRLFHFSDTWQLAMNTTSSIVTFLMVFVLNSTQARDTVAINVKLDAIVLAVDPADNRVVAIENEHESKMSAVVSSVHENIPNYTVKGASHGCPDEHRIGG